MAPSVGADEGESLGAGVVGDSDGAGDSDAAVDSDGEGFAVVSEVVSLQPTSAAARRSTVAVRAIRRFMTQMI